ncbi:MAG TPA: glycoside hydrolase family 15 protein [Verrucomicrobiae bacterium]|nr:glycoside hydrolase family 15 protein [Verrucomicrobiae bacterium]
MSKIYYHAAAMVVVVTFSLAGVESFAFIEWPGAPSPDGYPSDPASRIHHWMEEAIVGNQYMTVQLDANGTVYDIYYPSSGFLNGSGTSNEGYHGPEGFVGGPCSSSPCYDCGSAAIGPRLEANGQMNMIAAMGGIQIGTNIYWMKNDAPTGPGPAGYDSFSQGYVTDNNVLVTSNRLNVAGNTMRIVQYDFCPTTNTIPPVATGGGRTNYGVYVKRYLITNLENSPKSVKFYFDANFNVKGDNVGDFMYMDYDYTVPALGAGQTNHTMVVVDGNNTLATGGGCGPDGYGDLGDSSKEYNPKTTASYNKSATVTFGVCMKEVTNAVTGAGVAFDGSWRDHSSTDHQEGWIGKSVSFVANETKEIDIMIVGSWDDNPGQSGVHDFWGRPLVNWFYANDMAGAQNATEAYWTAWLARGVNVDLPGSGYDKLFDRSKLVTALHIDAKTGSIIAGMHNGAYPFVWPRDGVYAAITLDRLGYTQESENFYRWLRDVAYRNPDDNPGGKSFFFQKYTTDGHFAWTSPQIDETASVPWGAYYHYLTTKDGAFLTNYWSLVRESAYASYWSSTNDSRAHYDFAYNLMNGNNVWEDSFGLFIYSNSSVVRGLRDAANLADLMNSPSEASTWRGQAEIIRTNGIIPRVNARVEPADISHLGMAVPYEVFTPTDSVMVAVNEWIHGNGAPAGGFNDNLEETGGGNVGYWCRYNHNVGGAIDNYWNGGPWHLSTAWYGEYNMRWQDYAGGKALVDVGKDMLDKIVARLGPVGLGAEQIAPDYAQKYPGFWHQAAWPNVWESHSTFIDLMMMFLDYKPAGTNNNMCYFAPKLPTGWGTMTFNNMLSQGQRFNITVSETNNTARADINKLTTGPLNVDLYLRIPAAVTPVMVVTNSTYYVPSPANYDTTTGRVHIQCALASSATLNLLVVTYGSSDYDGDGLPDAWELQYGVSPVDDGLINGPTGDPDGDGLNNLQEYMAGTDPTNSVSALRITNITRLGNGGIVVTWQSVTGKNYAVQSADSLANPFADLSGTIAAAGSGTSYTNSTAIDARFYRVRLVP